MSPFDKYEKTFKTHQEALEYMVQNDASAYESVGIADEYGIMLPATLASQVLAYVSEKQGPLALREYYQLYAMGIDANQGPEEWTTAFSRLREIHNLNAPALLALAKDLSARGGELTSFDCMWEACVGMLLGMRELVGVNGKLLQELLQELDAFLAHEDGPPSGEALTTLRTSFVAGFFAQLQTLASEGALDRDFVQVILPHLNASTYVDHMDPPDNPPYDLFKSKR